MSTSTAASKHEWIIILPDLDGALARRMEIRPDHLKALTPMVDQGFWTFGGAFLEEPIQEGQTPKVKGSIMLALASSKEEVIDALKKDIYTKENIWDWNKVQIHPFRSAIRKEL